MTKPQAKTRRYAPMSRLDIAWRCFCIVIALVTAVGGSLIFGQNELRDTLGVVLGGLLLTGILAFIAYGGPLTLLAALILAPALISWLVPSLPFIGAVWWLSGLAGWIAGAVLRSEWDRRLGRGAPVPKRSGQGAADCLEWRVGRKTFREAGFSEAALVAKIRSLDGDRRTLVSATRGEACLTVGGNAQGALVVCFSREPSKEDQWSSLTSPGSDHGQVDVKIGPMLISHASWETTTLDKALVATRYFHRKGRANPQLTWFSSPTIADWRMLSA